jgi:hypothetical protein
VRVSPWYQAALTDVTVRVEPRSYWIHCPSPLADQRVARLPSTVLAGRLPSLVLAETLPPPGVMLETTGVGVGVGDGPTSAKMLTSVTLFIVGFVLPTLPCPT